MWYFYNLEILNFILIKYKIPQKIPNFLLFIKFFEGIYPENNIIISSSKFDLNEEKKLIFLKQANDKNISIIFNKKVLLDLLLLLFFGFIISKIYSLFNLIFW